MLGLACSVWSLMVEAGMLSQFGPALGTPRWLGERSSERRAEQPPQDIEHSVPAILLETRFPLARESRQGQDMLGWVQGAKAAGGFIHENTPEQSIRLAAPGEIRVGKRPAH